MTETPNQTTPDVIVEEPTEEVELSRLQKFVLKHPRAAKITAIAGGLTAVAGVAITTNTMRKNRAHLHEASDHAKEALREVTESVSPTDTDN